MVDIKIYGGDGDKNEEGGDEEGGEAVDKWGTDGSIFSVRFNSNY